MYTSLQAMASQGAIDLRDRPFGWKGDTTQKSAMLHRNTVKVEALPQKYAIDPRPPHTRQKYEQTSGQNMTPNASNQGKFGSLGAICLFIFLPCMWGLGFQKESPLPDKNHRIGGGIACVPLRSHKDKVSRVCLVRCGI